MNTYYAFFNGKKIELEAGTILEAINKAREIFKPKKREKYMVSAILVAVNGVPVEHKADF